MATVGYRIRKLRTDQGFTMQELADKCGVSRATVSMWESGRRTPDRDSIEALLDIFNVQYDYLMGKEDVTERYLTEDELRLLTYYRKLSDPEKGLIRRAAGEWKKEDKT